MAARIRTVIDLKMPIKGDSGGPLITSKSGDGVTPGQNYQLIGVTSWRRNSCAEPGFPGVYSRYFGSM